MTYVYMPRGCQSDVGEGIQKNSSAVCAFFELLKILDKGVLRPRPPTVSGKLTLVKISPIGSPFVA